VAFGALLIVSRSSLYRVFANVVKWLCVTLFAYVSVHSSWRELDRRAQAYVPPEIQFNKFGCDVRRLPRHDDHTYLFVCRLRSRSKGSPRQITVGRRKVDQGAMTEMRADVVTGWSTRTIFGSSS